MCFVDLVKESYIEINRLGKDTEREKVSSKNPKNYWRIKSGVYQQNNIRKIDNIPIKIGIR